MISHRHQPDFRVLGLLLLENPAPRILSRVNLQMDNETHWFPLEFITAIHGANLDAESLPQSSPVPSPGQEEAAAFSEAEQPDDSASEVEGWLLALDSQGHEKTQKTPTPLHDFFDDSWGSKNRTPHCPNEVEEGNSGGDFEGAWIKNGNMQHEKASKPT